MSCGDGGPRGGPLGLVAEDLAGRAPAADLGHRVDDRVVGQGAAATGLDLAGHEVAADDVERRRPAPDPDPVALAQGLEPVVVADRVEVMLGAVPDEVDPQPDVLQARQPPVVVDALVADRTGRQLDVAARRLAVRQAAAPAEARAAAAGGRAALEAGCLDHRSAAPRGRLRGVLLRMPEQGRRDHDPIGSVESSADRDFRSAPVPGSADRVVELAPDRPRVPVRHRPADHPRGLPARRSSRRPPGVRARLRCRPAGRPARASPVPAASRRAVSTAIASVRIGGDRRSAAPRCADDEPAEAAVGPLHAERRLDAGEGIQQVTAVLAGRGAVEGGHRRPGPTAGTAPRRLARPPAAQPA